MKRRDFLGVLGGGATAAWPFVARAQQPAGVRRIGVLMAFAESDREGRAWIAAFLEGLQKVGWTVGRNIRIDTRWGQTTWIRGNDTPRNSSRCGLT